MRKWLWPLRFEFGRIDAADLYCHMGTYGFSRYRDWHKNEVGSCLAGDGWKVWVCEWDGDRLSAIALHNAKRPD